MAFLELQNASQSPQVAVRLGESKNKFQDLVLRFL